MDFNAELEVAIKSVVEAGKILMKYFRTSDYSIEYKNKDKKSDPVTSADTEANDVIKRIVFENFPNDGWLSEESVDDQTRFEKKRVWIIDPLDGTNDFIRGVNEFAVSIALVVDGVPVVGVVYNPAVNEMFYAVRGRGAFKNGERLKLNNDVLEFSNASIVLSRKEFEKLEKVRKLGEMFKEVKFRESVAYKIVSVASGWADAFVSVFYKSEWDIAGGYVIAVESGLKVSDINGEEMSFNQKNVKKKGVIIAPPSLHEKIVNFFKNSL